MQPPVVPLVNTIESALELARSVSRSLTEGEIRSRASLRIFAALASDEREGMFAFLIWRARGEMLRELAHRL